MEDLAVGAYDDDTGGSNRGAVHVLFMNTNGTAKSTFKIASGVGGAPTVDDNDAFGASVTSLGDLDGDGTIDLAVGAYRDKTGGVSTGAVHVLFMNANGSVKSSTKIAHNTSGGPALTQLDFFGSAVAGLDDVNGDGVEDLAVGARRDYTGAVYVLLLNANGTVKNYQKIPSVTGGHPFTGTEEDFGDFAGRAGRSRRRWH